MPLILHLDYEGRSGVDITEVGSHRWSIDPRFEIFMAAVSRHDSDEVLLWINPLFKCPDMMGDNEQVETLLAKADIVWAHNAPNEMANTWGAITQGKACPFKQEPPVTVWRCSAAVARKAALPFKLETLCDTLELPVRKDRRGKTLIKLFCHPDEETGKFNEPRDYPDEWLEFCSYCVTDVRAEKAAGAKLKAFELTGAALATFQFDLRMNQRGIPINVAAARNAQRIIDEVQSGVVAEFRKLTGLNPTQREKVRQLVGLPNMQGPTVEEAIYSLTTDLNEAGMAGDAPEEIDAIERKRDILRMFQTVSFAAVKKIQTMLDCACPDGRVRGAHMYYGAGPGRWSSKLLQVQNFRKPDKAFSKMIDGIYHAIRQNWSVAMISEIYGDPLECLANAIRSFIHDPDHEILDGDFNAVEGRIAVWIAGETEILEAWRTGKDLYKRAAAFVEDVPESSILNPSPERNFGKVVELACQFGLGTEGFIRTCAKFGIECDEAKAKRSVHEYYRPTHPKVVARWWQHDSSMREAIRHPGSTFGPFTVRTIAGIPYMLLKLPSGRSIAYPRPMIEIREPTAEEREAMEEGKVFRENRFEQVTYWGEIRPNFYGRIRLWGSKVFENEVQGIAADFMAHGAITAEARGMPPFMLVHDQGLALRTRNQTVAEYEAALGDLPVWAKGFPMRVEAKINPYFKK